MTLTPKGSFVNLFGGFSPLCGSRLANADRFSLDSTVFVPSQPIAGLCLPVPTAATNAYAKRKTGGKQRDAVLFLFNRIIHDGTFAAVYVVC